MQTRVAAIEGDGREMNPSVTLSHRKPWLLQGEDPLGLLFDLLEFPDMAICHTNKETHSREKSQHHNSNIHTIGRRCC